MRIVWGGLLQMKHYFIATLLIFAVGIYIGFASPEKFQLLLSAQQNYLKGMADSVRTSAHPTLKLFGVIYMNNLVAVGSIFLGGAVVAIFPIYALISNGAMLGYVARTFSEQHQWGTFWRGILPHGVVEIPVVLIAAAYGIRLGFLVAKTVIMLPYRGREATKEIRLFWRSAIPLFVWLAGLLLLAALVESTLTVWLAAK